MLYLEQRNKKTTKREALRTIFAKAKYIAKNFIYTKRFSQSANIKNFKHKSILLPKPQKFDTNFSVDRFDVKLVKSGNPLLLNAQKLRFNTFFNNRSNKSRYQIDIDKYDKYCDHLVVIDNSISPSYVVGTYRLLINSGFNSKVGLYTETEFDLHKLKKRNVKILEAGRSCVHEDYRDGKIIRLLWRGLSSYISQKNVDFIVGCASFEGCNISSFLEELSFLHHNHLAPKKYLAKSLKNKTMKIKYLKKDVIDNLKIFKSLPPLIKAYLRVGSWIGQGAVIDEEFKTTDVCIILKVDRINTRYLNMAINK